MFPLSFISPSRSQSKFDPAHHLLPLPHLLLSILFLSLLTLSLVFARPVYANPEFSTDFVTTYTVNLDGTTSVNQQITLTNKLSNIYATQYALELGSTRLENIKATTLQGTEIPFNLTQTDNTTAITLTFTEKVVGKNQSHVFNIAYTNRDISIQNGKVLEVNIPRISNPDSIDTFSVQLLVPVVYGNPSTVTPKEYQISHQDRYNLLTFDKNAIQVRGITALFGDRQIFDFNLQYHLENPTVNDGITQIALPPDTSYQKLYYSDLSPRPLSITTDPDGNWLATYSLKPKQRLTVVATGQALIHLEPQVQLSPSPIDPNSYLSPQTYWETTDPEIVKLAQQLKTPQAIYQYLVDTFSYDYQKLDTSYTRMGALQAISSPQSVVCQEFTDAFIAIARAAGIPARELNGYAFTQNSKLRPLSLVQDVLHSWPEYYDSQTQTWIPIDPTWGNTTGGIDYFSSFDLNHFVFVIHGLDSQSPYPAGYYKLEDVMSKDVTVTFSDHEPLPIIDFEVDLHTNVLGIFGLPLSHKLSVSNNSNIAFYQLPLTLESSTLKPTPTSFTIDTLLPFTTSTHGLKLASTTLLPDSTTHTLNLNIQNFITSLPVQFITHTQLYVLILFSLVTLTLILALITWRLLVYRRRRIDSLRRQSQKSQEPDQIIPPHSTI